MFRLTVATAVTRWSLAVSLILGAGGCDRVSFLPNAPLLVANTISGRVFDLGKEYGHPVVVVFWSPSCAACIREIPRLIELNREFNEEGLRIVSVTMPYDIPSRVVDYSKKLGITFDIILDLSGGIGDTWKVQQIPKSFLVNQRGQVQWQELGEPNFAVLKQMIKEQLTH